VTWRVAPTKASENDQACLDRRSGSFLVSARVGVQQLDYLLADPARVGAQAVQDLGGLAVADIDQAKQQVAGIGFGVAERFSFA
jgi:hypothetical protein